MEKQIDLSALPATFVWGVATASYQIEGGRFADGRGESNWDVFSARPGAIARGENADHACDHYHRLDEDLDLIQGLGVSAYRFSVAWTRLLPEGTGRENPAGIAFYDRMIDGLLDRGITPYLTLFHWDYPQALERLGGFRNPKSPLWFEEFTRLVARRFGDRVKHYLTLNEPHAFIEGGLKDGRHAPGLCLPQGEVLLAAHHALLAHGRAVQVLRSEVKDSYVTYAPVLQCAVPETDRPEDLEAARRFTFQMTTESLRSTPWWMDPVYGRGYPEDGLRLFGKKMPAFTDAEMDLIAQPLDAAGFNLYDTAVVRRGISGEVEVVAAKAGCPRTAFHWPVSEDGHYYGPKFIFERYQLPVLITENGLSCRDWIHEDGKVKDPDRVDFLLRHLRALARACAEGVPVAGYFHWSLLDNFEWNHGYRERFGLIFVDYDTLERTPKQSYFAYKNLITEHQRQPS